MKHDPQSHNGQPAQFPTWARILVSISLVCFGIANVGMNIGILSQVGSINRVEQAVAANVLGHLPHQILTIPNSGGAVVASTSGTSTSTCYLKFPTNVASLLTYDQDTFVKNIAAKTPSVTPQAVAREYKQSAPTVALVHEMLHASSTNTDPVTRILVDGRASGTPISVTSVMPSGVDIEITYTVTGTHRCMSNSASPALTQIPTATQLPITFIKAM
jgi:hypothetical protein